MTETTLERPGGRTSARPRLGFLGCGWIGRHRLQAVRDAGVAAPVVVADTAADAMADACALLDEPVRAGSLDEVLDAGIDGVVIATPSALHAEQAIAALERGVAVFCQKPLGRTRSETRRVIDAARAADRLLAVDLSYRGTRAMQAIRRLVEQGELGEVYAAELVFHNAYGPDKPWFYDAARSGGGCLMDLGIHLVDLALWTLGHPAVERVDGRLFAQGRLLGPDASDVVEDYALAQLDLSGGAVARIACSWNLAAGRDAVIEAVFYGSEAGAALRNVGGSFWDFRALRLGRRGEQALVEPPDDWGGRAIVAWARRLAADAGFDPAIEQLDPVAAVLDQVYGR
jgi:predicted dehydrogenase